MFSREQLVSALERDELFLAYQPQVLPDGTGMAGVEALVRWQHPMRGPIGPKDFLFAVEAHGLSDDLGTWVLKRACRDALRWPGLTLSVNVSPTQFRKARFVERLVETVRETGFLLTRLELEIVETAFFEDPASAEAQLRHLRTFGIGLALDDFGIGYSSLSYLRRMPFTKLKIDKSFVDDVSMMHSAAIVHAVIALGRALGLKVTAEGVETAEQQQFLRVAGVATTCRAISSRSRSRRERSTPCSRHRHRRWCAAPDRQPSRTSRERRGGGAVAQTLRCRPRCASR